MSAIDLSVIIATQPSRLPKLRRLLKGLCGGPCPRAELVLVVDAEDRAPIELAQNLLGHRLDIFGTTQVRAGQSPARHRAIESARGRWLLLLDDDMIPGCPLVETHLRQIEQVSAEPTAWLGPCGFPAETLTSPWMCLLDESQMVIPWSAMARQPGLDYRSFISAHLCVEAQRVRDAGSFDPRFAGFMHEDIELGWRLQERDGLVVRPLPVAHASHDHPLSPLEYCRREWFAGVSARAARGINAAFHDATWGGFGDLSEMHRVLLRLFSKSAARALSELEAWAQPGPARSEEQQRLAYLAHLPLKRLLFAHGYVGESFESLWRVLSNRETPALNAPATAHR